MMAMMQMMTIMAMMTMMIETIMITQLCSRSSSNLQSHGHVRNQDTDYQQDLAARHVDIISLNKYFGW